ncbi:Hsp33 family molecular chaperone [Pseudaminobacter arsenicus]|uniref:Hsp33 family molecular chaperone n=1 Tax=Borborobacter arsenicus TaxID=1851146 RepID=A0A432V9Q5_9HYPH|nr:Hsp33 family molecular chaperone [Pseudaminobacter arsenicus]RUM98900.1 Hsp33 family molecular chaperone [Pseudaminobacter arsenicus]
MADNELKLGEFGFAGDDTVVPFDVGPLDVRGRMVQLGPVLDQILARHAYPEPVARLLAEAVVVTVLLGTSLKFEGKFILQTRTDGPVDMLVADFATPQSLRAYARFDAQRLQALLDAGDAVPQALLGKGVLALTIDRGAHMQRYQGIVQLEGTTLEEAAKTYFRQSEQIPTDVKLSVGKLVLPAEGGSREHWRAGGLLAQFLPKAAERRHMPDLHGGDGDPGEPTAAREPTDNAWQELLALAATVEHNELLDPAVGSERLLYRLFNEHGVRVYDGTRVLDECSCSRERIRGILDSFSADEITESVEDGVIRVNCEFCSKKYEFEPAEFAA